MSFKIITTTSVTRSCFTNQHQNCKTKTKTGFLVSDWSCPKTDSLRPHHWLLVITGRHGMYCYRALNKLDSIHNSFTITSRSTASWRNVFCFVSPSTVISLYYHFGVLLFVFTIFFSILRATQLWWWGAIVYRPSKINLVDSIWSGNEMWIAEVTCDVQQYRPTKNKNGLRYNYRIGFKN